MTRSLQSPLKIAIQGVRASFHDMAAQRYFADQAFSVLECASFRRLCQAVAGGEVDYAMMAIENSNAGSILTNYLLMEQHAIRIVGEVYQRIEMCLMALPGQALQELHTVQSHPMALLQCDEFLSHYPHLKVIEAADTAESAKDIREKNLQGVAAIAGRLAGEVYQLNILEKGIETNKQNYTRFLVISKGQRFKPDDHPDKASLRFEIPHRPGSLLAVLNVFEKHGINMTKLQSVPILGRPYEYSFHVDLEWQSDDRYRVALDEIKSKTINLIHFGDYKKDERPEV